MGTLCIDRRGTRLEYKQRALVIRKPDSKPRSVPLNLIERLLIIGSVELSSEVLIRLGEAGVGTVFMPARGQRRGTFLRAETHGDAMRRLGQYQLALSDPKNPYWARNLVRLRLAGQQRLLTCASHQRPDRRYALWPACQTIQSARSAACDPSLSLEQLRGLEGAGSAAFFRGFTSLFPDSLNFNDRNRRPPRDPVNALLSLGYTLAHGDALRAIMTAGLDPAIGFLHQPAWGRDSLACDLNEIARARVERLTWHLFSTRALSAEDFSGSPEEGFRLRKGARHTFWEVCAQQHRRWLKRAALTLARECARYGPLLDDRDIPNDSV
ncbi:CRISPR-associated endonuclease Cas1 [Halorhodospira halochloris]|uniref:CRISPR-associated endonuclease Cas1 n=1 Tax=Halorhodospira halochloris TaxID=1052 RepID=UPI001EE8B339|nr:CRISPR-associated endonuclease Cas1 [Halorhodospira halochloris]MCG5531150.1 CRISPR-associated endonuclease Cas1 [Halorhodospira halochloris]